MHEYTVYVSRNNCFNAIKCILKKYIYNFMILDLELLTFIELTERLYNHLSM